MSDKFDDDEDAPSYTLNEVIEAMEKRETEAEMVLGGDYGDVCTYDKGYMKRQAIFSCLTCTPEGNAGICTACVLSCHEGHNILELWTKRNFRCDCGNSKFGSLICKLQPSKDTENADNKYNHNFKGIYCSCNRPYPDPEAEDEEEMVQCCVCEDWFHEEHLGLDSSEESPVDDEGTLYEDLICPGCSAACSFLTFYPQNIFVSPTKQGIEGKDDKGKGILEEAPSTCVSSVKMETSSSNLSEPCDSCINLKPGNISGAETLLPAEIYENKMTLNKCSQDGSSSIPCKLSVGLGDTAPVLESKKAMFLQMNWRDVLCRCEKCLKFYNQNRVSFLIDKDDTIAEYERQAKQRRNERVQREEQSVANLYDNLGHIEKFEIINGIREMNEAIAQFAATRDESKPITPLDIHELFDNLRTKRRRQM